jgi:hypothetical protein
LDPSHRPNNMESTQNLGNAGPPEVEKGKGGNSKEKKKKAPKAPTRKQNTRTAKKKGRKDVYVST